MIINNNKIKNKINENSKDKNRVKKVMLSFISGGIIGLIFLVLYSLVLLSSMLRWCLVLRVMFYMILINFDIL